MTTHRDAVPDLFTAPREEKSGHVPLAERMRPAKFEDFVGQDEITAPDRPLRRAIESDRLSSVIFWGPPGSGKTTLAHLIARHTKAHFVSFSAVASGVPELRALIKSAEQRRTIHGQRTILFVDEIHRFNKAQQDAFLPHVERGTVILVGATTENPSFEVISPLLSRSLVIVLKPLSNEALGQVLDRALTNTERGLGTWNVRLAQEARQRLIAFGNGDAMADELDYVPLPAAVLGVALNALAAQHVDNVRVYCHDAVEVLQHEIAPESLDEVRIYFPDPWHKKRHHKRRLVQAGFVELIASKLRADGLFHLATDWAPYAEQMIEVLEASPHFINPLGPRVLAPRPAWRIATHFQKRGEKLGHAVFDLLYRRRP